MELEYQQHAVAIVFLLLIDVADKIIPSIKHRACILIVIFILKYISYYFQFRLWQRYIFLQNKNQLP